MLIREFLSFPEIQKFSVIYQSLLTFSKEVLLRN